VRAGRSVAFLAAVTAFWLAGIGFAFADPSSGSSTPGTSASSSAAAPTGTPGSPSPAAPTGSASPTATATASDPTTATASPTAHAPSGLTATFNNFCSHFGFDVTNGTAVAHTVHILVNFGNTLVGPPVVVPAGATVHVPLAENTEPASEVQLVDENGGVISSLVIRFCTDIVNFSATIAAGATYTKDGFASPSLIAPSAQHGVVTGLRVSPNVFGEALRYTPNPCFAGTDRFGYSDFVPSQQGVITVTVLPGPCRISVHRSTTDCATSTVTYTATNPYSLPAHLIMSNSTTPGADKDLVLSVHHTTVIATVSFAHPATAAQVTFAVRDSTHTVLTDHVTFPCPSPTPSSQSGSLAATGAAPAQLAGFGAAAVALGTLITYLVRARKPRTRR
jgi:hypothetical protein